MAGLSAEVDVAVIGAGAAGIAAARRVVEAGGASVLVVEARQRAGGRAYTIDIDGHPADLGCEWLHSADRNVLVPLAEQFGLALDRTRPDWTTRLRRSGAGAAAEADWVREREAHYWAIRRAAMEPEDRAASTVLEADGRWNLLLDAISTWANAVELEHLSVKDNDRYENTEHNWRVLKGLGHFVGRLAEGLPFAFDAAVSRVDHHGRQIRIETSRGTIEAGRAIIAVPTAAIAEQHLAFDPPLPDKVNAAAGLPLGLANKLFLRLDPAFTDADNEEFLVGSTTRRETMSYQVRPLGRPRINCFFGGRFAAQLERDGIEAMADFATDELAGLFGSAIRQYLSPSAASFWRADPFARGSYSYALPGHADDRAILAAPVDDRLFFAGEACSPNFFSTAHGAYETGLAAADAALKSLGR